MTGLKNCKFFLIEYIQDFNKKYPQASSCWRKLEVAGGQELETCGSNFQLPVVEVSI
jgi:hypothetical protein